MKHLIILFMGGVALVLLNGCVPSSKLTSSTGANGSNANNSSLSTSVASQPIVTGGNASAASTSSTLASAGVSANTAGSNQSGTAASTTGTSGTSGKKAIRSLTLSGDSSIQMSRTDSIYRETALGNKYSHGNQMDMNVVKAKAYYKDAAKGHSARATYQLALIYSKEPGANHDRQTAIRLFKKAAALGYAPAMVSLAHLYQHGESVAQDFSAAFQLYSQAAGLDDLNAIYHVGYLYYKGFGTQQSYQNAIDYFTRGANRGNARCVYMLGSCYLHGYGVVQDLQKAQDLFTQALKAGDDHAVYAAIYNQIDSAKAHPHLIVPALPTVMPQDGNTADADSLQGKWTGKLYTYDWSHQIVEEQTRMTLDLQSAGGKLTGTWSGRSKTILQFSAVKDSTSWKVEKTSTDKDKNAYFRLNTITCKINRQQGQVSLTGNLERIERKDNEPLRPTYFVLYKGNSQTDNMAQDTTFVINRIYPNPITSQVSIDFTVIKSDNITFQIHTLNGLLCYSMKPKAYKPGVYSITIYPSLPEGSYNFVALGRQYQLTQIIIKK